MKKSFKIIVLIGGIAFLSIHSFAKAESQKLPVVQKVDLNKYLGTWYEIARKPLYFQKKCDYNVSANYSLNESGTVKVDNKCFDKDGNIQQSIGEAFVQNKPYNSKLKVSFLPKVIRWLPIARGDYWIIKLDDNYQTALVGSPDKKYLWLLSRSQSPAQSQIDEYLNYAKSIGYNLDDLIHTKQR